MAKVTIEHNLAVINPALAKEWHPTKNGDLSPHEVTPYSTKKVWWICEKGHEWEATISNRNQGYGCPYCRYHKSRRKTIEKWTEKRLQKLRQRGDSPARTEMRKVGNTPEGNILVEITPEMWKQLTLGHGVPADLSEALVNYRKKHGLNQFQMAEKIGIGRSRLQLIEYGMTNISFRTYQRIISVIS